MKLPWKSDDGRAAGGTDTEVADIPDSAGTGRDDDSGRSRHTPGKGRPTRSRREAERRRRGPVAPPPTTRAEARARKKELKNSMSRADRRKLAEERRAKRTEQREKMMAGDERYLMARDKGPVKRFARDIVDSRRNLAGLFVPFAIFLLLVMFTPALQIYANILLLIFVVFLAIDGYILGRLVNRRVRERFPDASPGETGFQLGWYSFTRAMQMRRMRAPKPQVSVGDEV